jgi:hypothetical protein
MSVEQQFDEQHFSEHMTTAKAFCYAIEHNEPHDHMYGCFVLDLLSSELNEHSDIVVLLFDYEEVKNILFELANKLKINEDYLIICKSINKE